jgi:hypothetical protein
MAGTAHARFRREALAQLRPQGGPLCLVSVWPAVAATISCALLLGVTSTAGAQTATRDLTKRVPVTGTAKNGKTFKGTYTIDRFVSRKGQVFAVGTLKGRLKHRHVARRDVRIPVSNFAQQGGAGAAQVACNVLTLTLGPLDLNLLGLRIQLNQVNLRITAIPGGGLLGDLLCGIANLLNPPQLTGGNLAAVLNSLLALVPRT